MACFVCIRFHRDKAQLEEWLKPDTSLEQSKGWCMLYPKWVEVASLHVCGQFVPDDMTRFREVWISSRDAHKEAEQMRQRALAAEKKLKELRQRKKKD